MENKFDFDNLLHESMNYQGSPDMELLQMTKQSMRGKIPMKQNKFKAIPTFVVAILVALALPATAWGAYAVHNNFRITRGEELLDEHNIEIDVSEDDKSVKMVIEGDGSDFTGIHFTMEEGEDGVVEIGIDEVDFFDQENGSDGALEVFVSPEGATVDGWSTMVVITSEE